MTDIVDRLRGQEPLHLGDRSAAADVIERLRAELAECKRDAERLNWLEQNQSGVYPVTERVRVPTTTMMPRYIDEWRFVGWSVSSRFDELPNIRNAIDAALAADGNAPAAPA